MNFAQFLIKTLLDLAAILFLMRVWMQMARVDYYNPFSQTVVKLTQPLVGPLRRFIPAIGSLDSATVILAYLLVLLKCVLIILVVSGSFSFSPILLLVAFISLVKLIGKMLFWVLLLRALLSWFSQGRNPVEQIFVQLTEPFLSLIRRILPNTGMLDFSVMIAMFILLGANYLIFDLVSSIGLGQAWVAL